LKPSTVAVFVTVTLLFVNSWNTCAKDLPKIEGYGSPGVPNIPGRTDDERWGLVRSKLHQLCKAKRDEVYKILGVTSRTAENRDHSPTWSFRMTSNESLSPHFEDKFYQLQIRFNGNAVESVEVCRIKVPVSPVISK